jgi:hypothetical protein
MGRTRRRNSGTLSNVTTDGLAPPAIESVSGELVGYSPPELPAHLVYPLDVFADAFTRDVEQGRKAAKQLHAHVVGLARDCDRALVNNLAAMDSLRTMFGEMTLHIEENDSRDLTKQILTDYSSSRPWATVNCKDLGRIHRGSEFAGQRTVELAEYRTACQASVPAGADVVIVFDFDAKGGFSPVGVAHGIHLLATERHCACVASVSLIRSRVAQWDGTTTTMLDQWIHYDAWALRLNSWFDDYRAGMGSWKHQWIPPVGSPFVPVCSAFGGMAIYRAGAYRAGRYTGEDCEHVKFHQTLPGRIYLNPSMRVAMDW